jgi:endonuclease/exonuclease/phosphatase family metal-dependent hydrolase
MLKIMTLNLNYTVSKHGPWNLRKELIKEVIREASPDIIAFQAVSKDPGFEQGKDQASQLKELLPNYKHHFFQPSEIKSNGSQEGSAILSKIPIAEKNFLQLKVIPTEDHFKRVLLRARFDLADGPFYLFNGHFSWVNEQAELNIKETLPYISRFNGKAILVGDLNTASDSLLFQPIKDAGWKDVWGELRSNEEGFTFESNKPFTRIDYAWANKEVIKNVQSIEILHKEQQEKIRLSDHKGLLITLDLKV